MEGIDDVEEEIEEEMKINAAREMEIKEMEKIKEMERIKEMEEELKQAKITEELKTIAAKKRQIKEMEEELKQKKIEKEKTLKL